MVRVSLGWPLAVSVITLAAFLLRLSQMHQSLFGDEVWTHQDIVGRGLLSVVRTVNTGGENSPPLFFALAWLSAKVGDPSVWIRLPSLILGTATLPLIYLLGRETVGGPAGVVGVAVVAASPFSTYYGIEARPYAMMAFFVALSTLALLKAVRTRSGRWWVLYSLAVAAAAYTHYTSVFVLATQAAWSLWACRDRMRQPLIAISVAALLYTPWLTHLRGKQLGTFSLLEPLNASHVLTDLLRPIVGYPYAPLRAIPTIAGLTVIGVAAVAGAVALAQRLGDTSADYRARLILIAAAAAASPLGLLLYSLLVTDIWLARGLYASVPAAAVLLGALLVALPGWPRVAALAVVMSVLIFGTVRAISPRWNRGPYRQIATYLDRHAGPRDPVVLIELALGATAVPAQFNERHPLVGEATAWRMTRPGEATYIVFEDDIGRALKVGIPSEPGFQLVSHVHYGSRDGTEVLGYVRR